MKIKITAENQNNSKIFIQEFCAHKNLALHLQTQDSPTWLTRANKEFLTLSTMKKIIFSTFILILTSCGKNNELLIKSSNEDIINQSLRLNPIGTSWETVVEYCASSKMKCDTYASKGFVHHPNGYSSKRSSVIGAAHIRHPMGSYRNTIFTNLSKTIFWAFDNEKKLIGIWVTQDIDAP